MSLKSSVYCVCFFCHLSIANSLGLTYDYTIPYEGGARLTIYNSGDTPVTINEIQFQWNTTIKDKPWGGLWGWQSTITTSPSGDEIHSQYVIQEKPQIIINPQSSAYLSMNLQNAVLGGPLAPNNLAMNPTNVKVAVTGITGPVLLTIKDACQEEQCKDPGHGKTILGYYPDWAYWRKPPYLASQLPWEKINAVGYAFFIFDNNGNVSLYDKDSDSVNIPIIAQARQRYPYLRALVSFGGWSWASTPLGWQCTSGASPQGPARCFSQMTSNEAALKNFVDKAILAMKEVQFNGIDIDWEYPLSSEDAKQYVLLMQKLRTGLNEQSRLDHQTYYLTTAVGAGPDKINALTSEQWKAVADVVDSIDVMTYDFHGDWDTGITGSNFMSAMQLDPKNDPTAKNEVMSRLNVTDAMNAYLTQGVPAQKLLLGIPLYGRMVQIEQSGMMGLYQAIVGTPQGEWDTQPYGFTGMINYLCIADHSLCNPQYTMPTLTLVNPDSTPLGQYSKTPWGYSKDFFITYDDAQSAAYKANWVLEKQFLGVMLWDFTGDFKITEPRSIINTIQTIFQSSDKLSSENNSPSNKSN